MIAAANAALTRETSDMDIDSTQDRKQAIREYKQTIQPMGIYQVRNLSDGKIFVESSKNLEGTLNRCKFQLDLGSFKNKALQEDYSRLGADRFALEVLDRLSPKKDDPAYDYTEDLETLKTMWMDKLKPEYN
jgi:hypothetical protein